MKYARKWVAVILGVILLFGGMFPSRAEEPGKTGGQATEVPAATLEVMVTPESVATPEPTAEAEPTIIPEATDTPEPTAAPELTLEPTQEPTATPAPEGASFDTSVELKQGQQVSGEITSDIPVMYYRLAVKKAGSYRFLSYGALPVKAVLTEGRQKGIAAFEPNVTLQEGQDPEHFTYDVTLDKDTDYFLAVQSDRSGKTGRFKLVFTDTPEPEPSIEPAASPEPAPAVEPTASPEPQPSGEPTASAEPQPSAEPAASIEPQPAAEPTASPESQPSVEPTASIEPQPSAEPAEFAEPQPSVEPAASPEPSPALQEAPQTPQASASPSGPLSAMDISRSGDYPESAHPYANNMDYTWKYSVPNAIELDVTFSLNTTVESDKDRLYFYDYNGGPLYLNHVGSYMRSYFSGTELAGKTLTINSSGFWIRLTSNSSATFYGFSIDSIKVVYLGNPVLSTCKQSDLGTVTVAWESVPEAGSYIVSRKEGSGNYEDIFSTVSTSVTDALVQTGKSYTYKVTAVKYLDDSNKYSPTPAEATVRMLGLPGIPSVTLIDSTSTQVSWNGDPAAQGYLLYRSTALDGPYTQVADVSGTSYTDTGLTPKSVYYYKLAGYTTYNTTKITSPLSQAVQIVTLMTPGITKADQADESSATLEWSSVSYADSYELYRSASQNGTYAKVKDTTDTVFTDTGLTPGKVYYYKLRAVATIDSSVYGSGFSAVRPVQILGKSAFSTAIAASASTVEFKWTAITGAAGYTLYACDSETGSYAEVQTLSATSLSYLGQTAGALRFYKLAAYKLVDGAPVYGAASDVAAVLTMDAPVLMAADFSGAASASFTWTAVPGAEGYGLWRSASANGTYLEAGTALGTAMEGTGLTPGQTYFFAIRCYKTINGIRRYGAFSNVMPVQVLAKSLITAADTKSTGKITIKWQAVSGAAGYTLYTASCLTGTYKAVKTFSGTSLEYSGLSAGKVYYFKVAAYRAVKGAKVYGTPSDVVPAATIAAPAIKTLSQSASGGVSLTWSAVPGASGYTVFRSTSASGAYAPVKSQSGTSCADSGLTAGSTYYYKVKAYKSAGNLKAYGMPSTAKSLRLLGKTSVLSATAIGASTIRVKWKAVSGAKGYALYRATSESGTYSLVKTGTGTSLDDTGLTAGKTYYYKVAAYLTVGTKKIYSARSDSFPGFMGPNAQTRYRALLVGQSNFWYLEQIHGSNDSNGMKSMLVNLNMNGKSWSAACRNNLTASQILSAIPSAFAGATNNDVSLFFYSGHGSNGPGKTAGAICGVDCYGSGGLVTATQLRSALDKIPGTVIVILDSCGSGAVIKSANGQVEAVTTKEQAQAFNQAVISAFGSGIAKTGELRSSKYIVLTSCAYYQSSYEYDEFGLFTLGLCEASGWDMYNETRDSLYGDSNGDSIVTLKEAYAYVRAFTSELDFEDQVVQAYPSNSAYPLFRR